MPAATTLCIVNLQPSEAKVEALFDSFVSLREEVVQGGANGGVPDNHFMYDDDDGNYQVMAFKLFATYSTLRWPFHIEDGMHQDLHSPLDS